jgi:hypothetical protein
MDERVVLHISLLLLTLLFLSDLMSLLTSSAYLVYNQVEISVDLS